MVCTELITKLEPPIVTVDSYYWSIDENDYTGSCTDADVVGHQAKAILNVTSNLNLLASFLIPYSEDTYMMAVGVDYLYLTSGTQRIIINLSGSDGYQLVYKYGKKYTLNTPTITDIMLG